jgi:nucleoside-diphosphate-sugar epimerase
MDKALIVLAGATGSLGRCIATDLIQKGASVRALVRKESAPEKVKELQQAGASIAEVDFDNPAKLTGACSGGSCVVSALAGLRDVIVEMQAVLLDSAVEAGVQRFIPSDYSIDFTKLPDGTNRNLDLRRDFHTRLDKTPTAATSILNGAFADMLTGQAPFILFKLKRVLYWGNPDQLMDFTTMSDTAAFTASAALDPSTPRILRIAGEQTSARKLAGTASEITGKKFRLLRAGSLKTLDRLIRITRALLPGTEALYPPWQGMQYMHNMFSGLAKLDPLDNDRYPDVRWTSIRKVLETKL